MTKNDENTSGMGKLSVLPDELKGWNWGAFLLNGFWCIGNRTYLIIFTLLVPVLNIIMVFVLGAKGNQWAWANRKWESIEHFQKVQKKWTKIGIVMISVIAGMFIILIPFAFISLAESDARTLVNQRINNHSELTKKLGLPLEASWFTAGSIQFGKAGGSASLNFSISGSVAEGEIFANLIESNDVWEITALELWLPNSNERVNLQQ